MPTANAPADQLIITESPGFAHAELALAGELDIATAPLIAEATLRIPSGATAVRCDLSELSFCDAVGLGALIAARRQLTEAGLDFSIDGARGIPLTVLTITETLDLVTSAAASPHDGTPATGPAREAAARESPPA